jgi:selenocysteine lyase/cysteine desulfurase
MQLTERLVAGLRAIPGVRLYCCDSLRDHISTLAANVVGLDPGDAGLRLDVKHNIATRTGLQCAPLLHQRIGTLRERGTVRFSIGAFNTAADVDAAVTAMAEVAAWSAAR